MRKILSLVIISLFMCGLVLADSNYTYTNVTILGPSMGGAGQTPPVEAIRVTVGSEDTDVAVGMVMTWGIEPQYTDGNALGLKVDICRRSVSEDMAVNLGKGPYAGVMITTASNDTSDRITSGWTNTNPTSTQMAMGFMAIRGFVDAYMDADASTVGGHLVVLGNTAHSDQGGVGYFGTQEGVVSNNAIAANLLARMSTDIGYCMELPSSDGLAKVWLR